MNKVISYTDDPDDVTSQGGRRRKCKLAKRGSIKIKLIPKKISQKLASYL